MPRLRCWSAVILFVVLSSVPFARADAVASDLAAVRARENERVAGMIAADRARLEVILSDDLHYAHSNGKIDTKATLIESLVSGRTDYESFDYRQQTFLPAGRDAFVMAGRVLIGVRTADGRQQIDLNVLAVWRKEGGVWRFLAWQSARHP